MPRSIKLARLLLVVHMLLTAGCQPVRPLSPDGAVAAEAVPVAAEAAAPSLAGRYIGSLSVAGMELEIVVNLSEENGAYVGTIDIPQQGAAAIPLRDIRIEPPAFAVTMLEGAQAATFAGEIDAEGAISGTFTQSGFEGSFTLAPEAPARAPAAEAAARAGIASTYIDPAGRFSAPVPTNWTAKPGDGYVMLVDPEESIAVYMLTSANADLEAAIADAWERVDPAFDLAIDETLDLPSAAGIEKTVAVNYSTGVPTRLVQGVAQLKDGVAYVNLFDAQLAGVQKRSAQLGIISSGFKILAQEEIDLSQTSPLTVTAAITEPLETFIDKYRAAFGIPGAAVGIVQNGELVYAQGFGVADPVTGAPITPATQMMIGSTGKSLTTMMMATMVDDGLMAWDTPVVELYPVFRVKNPELSQAITMRNLVCACTGVPRRDFEWLFNGDELSDADIVASLADFEFLTDFGEAFQYSNQMVATAGYIAGAVAAAAAGDTTGNLTADYMASLQARVLEPIGMTDTTLSFDAVEARGNYALPHAQTLQNTYVAQPLNLEKPLALVGSAGGHWSTLNDMARYMITQLADGVAPDGSRVVSAENLLETRKPQIAIDANTSYGLGWMVSSYKGQPAITHAGNTFGFTSEFTFLPDADLGIIVLTNGRATNLFSSSVTARLLELVFAQEPEMAINNDFLLERIAQQTAELEEQIGVTIDAAAVAPYLGTFRNDVLGELQVALVDGKLMLDAGEFRTELRPYADEASGAEGYLHMDPPLQGVLYRFEQDADGNPAIILGEAAIEYLFTKTE